MNTVTVTEQKNTVTVSETTNTVTVTKGDATTVEVATVGPQGPAFAETGTTLNVDGYSTAPNTGDVITIAGIIQPF